MMVESDSPLQCCASCGSPIDVSDLEPLSRIECPICGEPMRVGTRIGEFELQEEMGRGGMGVVYRAQDTQLHRPVAMKVLRRDSGQDGFLSELEAEAAITASINHPHVVKVYTTGSANGRFYIAMELVDRGTLDELMEVQGRLAEAQALEVASQIAQGLRAAHQHGLIHRDVKPGNILFSDAHTAKIVDFGLAIMEQASKGSNEIWGTPYYVSPERLDQKAEDFRSDIYSLGATIFHALAGRPPFEAEDATRVALKHLKSQAVSLQAFAPWISGRTAYVINRMLHKDPDARYQSYDELIEHLEYARNEVMANAARPQEKQRVVLETAEDRKREGFLTTVMIAVVVAIVLGVGLFFFLTRDDRGGKPVGAVAKSISAGGRNAQQFEAARQLLVQGKAAEAAEKFHALAAEKKTAQPFAQWCLLQEGIAWFHAGKMENARDALTQLRNRPYTPKEAGAKPLATFFQRAATIGGSSTPTPAAELQGIDPQSYSSLLLMVAGLKNWHLDEFDEGAALMRQFLGTAPGGGYVWMTEYRPLADDYLSDYGDFRGSMATLKDAKSLSELQAAVTTIRKVRSELRRPEGPLASKLEAAASETAARAEELQRKANIQLEAEKKLLSAARDKAAAFCREWRFKEARETLAPVAVRHPDLQREHRALVLKVEWLTRFRDTLVKDLAAGYAGPLKLKGGGALDGRVTKATDAGVELAADAGAVTKKWTELAPETVIAMGLSFIKPEMPAWQSGERRWGAGVYAIMAQRKEDARKLLPEAGRTNSIYGDQLALLVPPKRSNVAKGKPARSSDEKQLSPAAEGPEKAFDGDPNTAWSLLTPGPKWLQVDLGKNATIARWVVKHASSHKDPPEGDTADFVLQRSTDEKTWNDVDRVRNNTLGVTDRRVPQFTARYVRILIDRPNRRPNNEPTARLYEVELWASDPANEPVGDLFASPPAAAVPEFSGHDIGLTGTESSGQTMVDDRTGIFAIRASGGDMGNLTDGFRFLHRTWTGDGQVVIRMESIDRSTQAARTGLMFREGVGADARMVFVGGGPTPGILWQRRAEPKTVAASSNEPSISAPCWLKLERKGDTFTASASTDGAKWKVIGTDTIKLPPALEAGIAVTARTPNAVTSSRVEVINFGRTR